MKAVHYASSTVQNRPFDNLSLGLFWPLGAFIAAGLSVWSASHPAVSARNDFLPLFGSSRIHEVCCGNSGVQIPSWVSV